MFFLPSYTGFLSPKSWGLKCCTMYSTTSLWEAAHTQTQCGINMHRQKKRMKETPLYQLNQSPDQDALLWSESSSQGDGILIKQDTAGGCNISWSQAERQGQKDWGCEWGATLQCTVPWPSYKCGGWELALKEKVKGPDLRMPSWNLCLKPRNQKRLTMKDPFWMLKRWY